MTRRDAIVVGGGIAGAASARALAAAGADTLLLEQFHVGHTRGSSHGSSRIFRYSYDDPAFVRDCMESLPLWRALEEETGTTLYTRTGGFDLGENALKHRDALDACGAAWELLDVGEAAARYPGVRFPADAPILFQPDAGISHADVCVRACLESAAAHGAEVREGARVDALEPGDEEVGVRVDGAVMAARAVVVTAGAWTRALVAPCGIALDVEPTLETVVYFPFEEGLTIPSVVEWQTSPPFFSLLAPGMGLKVGWHHAGPPINDLGAARGARAATVEAVTDWVRERFPGAGPEPLHVETCIYTNTSDERFVLERHGRIVVGSACSGHGFKFGPLTGRRLAVLAAEVL